MSDWLPSAGPALPGLMAMDLGRHVTWAIVLLWAWMALRPRTASPALRRLWVGAGAALAGWTLWPGPAAPAYWLGLAFQSPSLSSSLLCLAGLGRWLAPGTRLAAPTDPRGALCLAGVGLLLGWYLLLDTLALVPGPLYAWGFSPAAVWLLLVAAAGLWLAGLRQAAGLLGGVALLFVVSRLPSGNLWDALLDPWLWGALHLVLLRRLGVNRFRAA